MIFGPYFYFWSLSSTRTSLIIYIHPLPTPDIFAISGASWARTDKKEADHSRLLGGSLISKRSYL